jgi:LmbE family N-acetylglucosaminyl deacetylase/glycosyltransferase involved in cell wall biosynthesis
VIEAEAIPYEAGELRGERLLVLAPHPDDEVIGCGGILALHLSEGRAVRVLIATDGAAQSGGDPTRREEESRRGLAHLGSAELEFLRFPDRGLDGTVADPIRAHLLEFRPDLVLVPSAAEIHPDHIALSRAFHELVQRDETLFGDLAVARVAFYEVSHPLRPNILVDITSVAEKKWAAIAEHTSQTGVRDYTAYARGLNAYRTMTLPAPVKYAEAYHVVGLPALRETSFASFRNTISAPPAIVVEEQIVPISVIVRTKDRPALAREAVDSIRATGYPCEIVLVNDGGADPGIDGVRAVHHEISRGRSEAGNAGVREALNPFIAFLDDDDLFYPEHLPTLANATRSNHAAWYTDAVSAFLRPGPAGTYKTHARLRLYAQPYDAELLRLDNYIPLPTLLIPRESFLEAGGFDPAFDLFEDWDLLIRLSQRGDFLRIPNVTCEVRHFEGGTSVVLASPEGSESFRAAKLQVWEKHGVLGDAGLVAKVFERQKRVVNKQYSALIESKGQVAFTQREMSRLEREKNDLLRQANDLQQTMNAYAHRIGHLEGSVDAMNDLVIEYTQRVLGGDRLERENEVLRETNAQSHAELQRLRVEIQRLKGLLDMIFQSRTWKVHTLMEKLRGRG